MDNKIQKITACAFIHKDGKLFTACRALTKKLFPGQYELPGGHIEFGETMEDGLRREIKEEFNIDVNIGDPFYVFTYNSHNDTAHSVEVCYFVTMRDPNQKIELHPDDHSDYLWITQNEVLDLFDENNEETKAVIRGFEMLSKS